MFWNFRSGWRFFLGKVNSSQPPFVQFAIKVGGVFADKAAGDTYINSKLLSGTLTNSSFQNGLYTFETSAGAEVDNGFMSSLLASGDTYEDLTGLITTYGNNAFAAADGSTIKLGNGIEFVDEPFNSIQNSTIELGNFDVLNNLSNNSFGVNSSNNTWRFKGTIGSTSGDDLIFERNTLATQTIETIVANQTSNGGNVEGDLDYLINYGAVVSFSL